MQKRKLLSIFILAGILNLNFLPLSAMAWGQKKVLSAGIAEYKFEYVNMNWWESFNDEILKGYITKALDQNNDLKIASLKVEEYNQMAKIQFGSQLPSVYALPMLNSQKNAGTSYFGGSYMFPLMVNYEADILLRNRDKTKAAKKQFEASKFDERAAYIAISSAVASTYFNIIKTDKLVDIQQEIVDYKKQICDLTQKRNKQGLSSTADTVRADKELLAAETDLIEIEKNRKILLNHLAVLVGESPANADELKRIAYNDISFNQEIPSEIPSEVIVRRPDVLRAENQVEKAGLDVKIARKELLPSLNIGGLLMFSSSGLGSAFDWKHTLVAAGGGLLAPIFTGGKKIGNLNLKKNYYEQILQNYQKTNLIAIQEVNDALSNLKLDDEKYQQNLKKLQMEEKDFGYNEKKYKQGTISYLDLIQRKENLLNMNKVAISSGTDRIIDYISLYKATGSKIPTGSNL